MRRPALSEETLSELEAFLTISIVVIVKMIAKETNESRGELACPRCTTGTLRWSIAGNGHARVICDRRLTLPDGRDVNCVNVIE